MPSAEITDPADAHLGCGLGRRAGLDFCCGLSCAHFDKAFLPDFKRFEPLLRDGCCTGREQVASLRQNRAVRVNVRALESLGSHAYMSAGDMRARAEVEPRAHVLLLE